MSDRILLPTLQQLLKDLKDLDNWFLFGVFLSVPVNQLRKIESSHHMGDIERCKLDMLQYWLDNTVNASWKEVARALEQTDQLVLATAVKKKHLWLTTSDKDGGIAQVAEESNAPSTLQGSTATTISPSHSIPPLSSVVIDEIEAEVKIDITVVEDLQGLESLFSRTLVKVKRYLQTNCDLSDAQLFLDTLLSDADFSKCDSFDKLIRQLDRDYIDIFNTFRLRELVACFEKDELNEIVEAYEEKKLDFLKHTTVLSFQRAVVSRVEPVLPKGKAVVTIRIPKEMASRRTLKDIEELAKKGFEECHKSLIRLHAVPGSVIISWVLHETLCNKMEQLVCDNAAIFKDAGVEEVTVGGRKVFFVTQQEDTRTLSTEIQQASQGALQNVFSQSGEVQSRRRTERTDEKKKKSSFGSKIVSLFSGKRRHHHYREDLQKRGQDVSPTVSHATGHHIPSPTYSHQHSIAQSDQDVCAYSTVQSFDSGLGTTGSSTLISLHSIPDADSGHYSGHSHCTCNHDRNSYGSRSHLERPKTLTRYGYPDADNYYHPHHRRHRQYSEEQYGYVPGLKIIPPTPNSGETPGTPSTEPFSVPSPVSPGLQCPSHFKFNAGESTQGYTSTRDVAVNIAMYLMHKDCPNQENCPTCQLINHQFQHLLTRYEHAHSKDIKREKLHHRRSVRGTPKSLYPPKLGRQRSQSTSEVNVEELTMSSNEDSSTDAEVLTEPEGPRSRTFVPLPLSKIPRDLLASDSELAVTPSGHIPSPRRTLASPTKIHLKPSAPQSTAKGDRPPSNDSLTTSESRDNFKPGSEGYNLPLTALPLHSVTLV